MPIDPDEWLDTAMSLVTAPEASAEIPSIFVDVANPRFKPIWMPAVRSPRRPPRRPFRFRKPQLGQDLVGMFAQLGRGTAHLARRRG